MRRLWSYVLALVAIGALATAGAAQGSTVVPGQAIGDYQLGQTVDPMMSQLGPLHSADDLPAGTLTGYYWPLRRIGAIADKDSKKIVALVVSLDDAYKTDRGVGVGDQFSAVRGSYGKEDSVAEHTDDTTYIYDKLGIAFVVDNAGPLGERVSVIFVFPPGQYNSIFTQAG